MQTVSLRSIFRISLSRRRFGLANNLKMHFVFELNIHKVRTNVVLAIFYDDIILYLRSQSLWAKTGFAGVDRKTIKTNHYPGVSNAVLMFPSFVESHE
jgi:hypothetical protein